LKKCLLFKWRSRFVIVAPCFLSTVAVPTACNVLCPLYRENGSRPRNDAQMTVPVVLGRRAGTGSQLCCCHGLLVVVVVTRVVVTSVVVVTAVATRVVVVTKAWK
jgi:hypothetical protein